MPRGWVLFWTYCLVFCGLLGCGLVSVFNLEQLSVSVILNVSAPLSSLRYFIMHVVHLLLLTHSPWTFCCGFFHLYSPCFFVLKVSVDKLSSSASFHRHIQATNKPIKGTFISVTVFPISSTSFQFFLRSYISLLTSPICACMLSALELLAY